MRQNKIKKILEKFLKINIAENIETNLIDIENYDSMQLVSIIMEIQHLDNKRIPLEKLNKIFKIKDLLEL
tara:strand:+ start:2264 stop:2473 length:210 start_codon:yes stop_codon:yes gene_type:complete